MYESESPKVFGAEASPADQGAAEAEEGFVDVGTDFLTDAQPADVTQQSEGLLDDPAVFT